jgi:hypothetical protein
VCCIDDISISTYAYIDIYICMYRYVCMHACMHVCMCACECVCMYPMVDVTCFCSDFVFLAENREIRTRDLSALTRKKSLFCFPSFFICCK